MIDARAVGRQIGALRDDVEAGKEGDPRIKDQVHDVTLALFAQEFEGQQCPHGLLGGDHLRGGQGRTAHDRRQIKLTHQGHKQEEAAHTRPEGARRQTQRPHVGHGRRVRLHTPRALVIRAAGQAGEAFLAEQHGQGIDTDCVGRLGQLVLDIVDRQVLLPHGDGQRPHPVPHGGGLRPMLDRLEEPGALGGIVPKLVTEDPEGAGGVPEAARDDMGGRPFDEEAPQRFILPLEGRVGGEKEPRVSGWR